MRAAPSNPSPAALPCSVLPLQTWLGLGAHTDPLEVGKRPLQRSQDAAITGGPEAHCPLCRKPAPQPGGPCPSLQLHPSKQANGPLGLEGRPWLMVGPGPLEPTGGTRAPSKKDRRPRPTRGAVVGSSTCRYMPQAPSGTRVLRALLEKIPAHWVQQTGPLTPSTHG